MTLGGIRGIQPSREIKHGALQGGPGGPWSSQNYKDYKDFHQGERE